MIRVCRDQITEEIVYEVWLANKRYGLTYYTRKDAEFAEIQYAARYEADATVLMKWCEDLIDMENK